MNRSNTASNTPVRALPPAHPPVSVADSGRVRIGAGLGLPATRQR